MEQAGPRSAHGSAGAGSRTSVRQPFGCPHSHRPRTWTGSGASAPGTGTGAGAGATARGEHTHSETPIPRPRTEVARPVVQRASVRGQILDALRTALVAGELAPGAVYSAPALGERFGVSATPVREAMQQLALEGAVEVVPNRGFRVIERGTRELAELAEIRALIEVPVMLRLACTVPAARWAELRPLAEATVRAATSGCRATYAESDRAFHRAVLALMRQRPAGADRGRPAPPRPVAARRRPRLPRPRRPGGRRRRTHRPPGRLDRRGPDGRAVPGAGALHRRVLSLLPGLGAGHPKNAYRRRWRRV